MQARGKINDADHVSFSAPSNSANRVACLDHGV